jgi:hypothetical protein
MEDRRRAEERSSQPGRAEYEFDRSLAAIQDARRRLHEIRAAIDAQESRVEPAA